MVPATLSHLDTSPGVSSPGCHHKAIWKPFSPYKYSKHRLYTLCRPGSTFYIVYTLSGFSLFWMKDILVIPPFDLVNIFCLNSCVSKQSQSKSISTWVNSFFTKTKPYFLKTRTILKVLIRHFIFSVLTGMPISSEPLL